MKVVLVTNSVYPFHSYGGAERFYYYLSKQLFKEGIDVEVVTSGCEYIKHILYEKILFTFLPPAKMMNLKLKLIWFKLFNNNVRKYLTSIKFDLLHGTIGTFPYVVSKERKPVITQILETYSYPLYENPSPFRKVYNFLLSYVDAYVTFKYCDLVAVEVTSQGEKIKQTFNVPSNKIVFIPDGVDVEEIKRCSTNYVPSRESLKIEDADLVLINVNRLERNKGIEYLLNALKILNKQMIVKMIMIGTGSQEERIMRRIKKLGLQEKILHFKNIPYESMYKLYNLADISVTPTLYEGLPTVILEAMAAGKPIIASATREISDANVVIDDKNGFLVPPGDSKALALKIMEVYESKLFKRFGRSSEEIVKEYDWKSIGKRVIKIYEWLL